MKLKFFKFLIKWIAANLSIPFWVVGHVHLTTNIYHDLHEILASMGMNIIVATGFWLEWKKNLQKNQKTLIFPILDSTSRWLCRNRCIYSLLNP